MLSFDIQNHKPLREIVYEELKMKILRGEIEPGFRMMEVELAEDMGVSRTPVREAIRKLEKEGLVTIEPRRGAYASQISIADMVEILEVRATMEGLAAAYAADRITADKLLELKAESEAFNEAVNSNDSAAMIVHDTNFHHLIVESCENKTLTPMIEQLQELVLRFRYLYFSDFKRAEMMPDEHREILSAIEAKDVEGARAAATVHIDRLKTLVQEEGI